MLLVICTVAIMIRLIIVDEKISILHWFLIALWLGGAVRGFFYIKKAIE